MEVRQLRYFIAVADTKSFSRAAEIVYLSQSALSRQIMDLEKELGMPLFRRSTRQVELTEAGQAFVPAAKDFISRWEKLAPELRSQAAPRERAVTLTLGADRRALAEPARCVRMMEFLYGLRRRYPGILIMLRTLDYAELVRGLLDRTLDCALVLDRELEHRAEIESLLLGQEEMVLVFRSGREYRDSDYGDVITNRGLILVDREPQGLYHIVRILSDLRLEPSIRFCEQLEDMTMTVAAGESAAILPQSVVKKLGDPYLQVLRLPTERARLYFSLLWAKGRESPVLDVLKRELGDVINENDGSKEEL